MNQEDALWEKIVERTENKCLSCKKLNVNLDRPLCGSIEECNNYDKFERIIINEDS